MRIVRRFLRFYQSLFVSGAIVMVSVLALFVGTIPAVRNVTKMVSTMRSLNKEIIVMRGKDRVLRELDSDTVEQYARAAVSAVPTDKSLGTIFSVIDELTAQEGVTVTTVSLGSVGSVATESAKGTSLEEQKMGARLVPFSLVIEGPIEKVRNVVDRAVKIRRLFRVINFSLAFDEKTNITRSTLTMNAYYVGIPKMTNQITTPIQPLTDEEIQVLDTIASLPLLTQDISVSSASAQTSGVPVTADPFSP